MTKHDRRVTVKRWVAAVVAALLLLVGFGLGRVSAPDVHDEVGVVDAGGASGCCRAFADGDGGDAVVVPVTSNNGRHTSGLVFTLSGTRYETYLGHDDNLADGSHRDYWSSVAWPGGGGRRTVDRWHPGWAAASVAKGEPGDLVVVLAGGASGCCRAIH